MRSTVALALALVASLLVTASRPAHADEDKQRLEQSREVVQKVGIALMAWWVDHAGTDPGDPWERWQPLDWSECPALSHQEAQALLIPRYLSEVPEEDAWGNPLEICLRRDDLAATQHVAAVRSAGRDGVFDGPVYEPGRFPGEQLDRDLVWADGFFFTEPRNEE
jgi:hypothetical protein